ncbi:MAG TPA: class I SAM-dependent methyltransferase [Acetobacteraceae bacterium]|nr:class I SAM-dependent methyltransferase [Acetobacteraceae bacterium]
MLLCKCCGSRTELFLRVDSSRTCEIGRDPPFPPSGIDVDYVRCHECRFIFTDYLDGLTESEVGTRIYNSEYIRADPEFATIRPSHLADMLVGLFGPTRAGIEALDYGGGEGLMARLASDRGFARYDSFDPYFADQVNPRRQYELVTAFEVVEHSRQPLATFQEALSYVRPDGVLLFSTQLQPRDVGGDWGYIGPRNGHVSLHSDQSLRILAQRCGARLISLSDIAHILYFKVRAPIVRRILQRNARAALYTASLHGPAAFSATLELVRCGLLGAALHPRNVARVALTATGAAAWARGRRQRADHVKGADRV